MKKSRRRKERASVYRAVSGVFLECSKLTHKKIKVINLSELGIGVETADIYFPPGVGAEYEAQLTAGYVVVPVAIKLAHMTDKIAGFEFIESMDSARQVIHSYFEPELVAASLKAVQSPKDPKEAKDTKDTLHYSDDSSNGIEIQLSTVGKVDAFSIAILGNKIRWTLGGKVEFMQNGLWGGISDLLRGQILRLIRNAQIIDNQHRQQLEGIITTG